MPGKLQIAGRMRGALRSIVPAALKIAHPGNELDPLERDGLTARCHCDWPEDPDFFRQYQDLFSRCPAATVFNGSIWQTAVVNEFVPAGQFRLITVSRGLQLLAVLPLALNTSSMLETPGRWLTDYLDPLVDPQAERESWSMILELLSTLWDWSVGGVQLCHIRAGCPVRQIVPDLATKFGFDYSETTVANAPFITLPKSWEEYLDSLDRHERKEIKRKLNNAREKAHLEWRTLKNEEDLAPALDRALAALRQSESCKADFSEEVLVGFLRRVGLPLARQGQFYVQELVLEDQPAAWLICLRSDRGPMIYNTSYDFAQRQWSPGIVSFSLALQDAISAGAPIFNLLKGAEEYKKRLGAQDLNLFKMQLLPN
jgi:CelD/BcsL family acetyltransferase involved in cellulose biosynthesis